jgi:hypothetical protein
VYQKHLFSFTYGNLEVYLPYLHTTIGVFLCVCYRFSEKLGLFQRKAGELSIINSSCTNIDNVSPLTSFFINKLSIIEVGKKYPGSVFNSISSF